ncbi:MAG: STAS domain-containing protein [Methanomicrobiaceae archaeon]|nr:STAS domain-containing protein [Methanomicrobiaceae archaeon]
MEINALREDGILIFVLSGRFDSNGAEALDSEIKNNLHADDKSVVIDMQDVSYLSSIGIRVLISIRKEMKKREGTVILSSLQNYPSKILDMAGLLSFFKTEDSRYNAIKTAINEIENFSLIDEIKKPSTIRRNVRYTFESGSDKKGTLTLKGNVRKILGSDLKEADVFEEEFDDCYSIGLGSMGSDKTDAMGRLGEMIKIEGTIAWYPTDGSEKPDFFTPIKNTGEIVYYSGLNIKSEPLFNDIITVETDDGVGISLDALYEDIFSFAYERQRGCKGLIFIVIWGVLGGLYSSRMKKSPVVGNKPFAGGIITDPGNYPDWFYEGKTPEYSDETIISAGIIIDLKNPALVNYDESVLKSAIYNHPSEKMHSNFSSQNHCAVVRNVPWDKNVDLTKIAKQVSESGVIADIRHVLMRTTLKKAKIGISYIENTVNEN